MGRKKLETRAKRNNFTLTLEAQVIIDQQTNKSRFVSDAIVSYVTAPADKNKPPEPSTIEVKQKVAEPGKVKAAKVEPKRDADLEAFSKLKMGK